MQNKLFVQTLFPMEVHLSNGDIIKHNHVHLLSMLYVISLRLRYLLEKRILSEPTARVLKNFADMVTFMQPDTTLIHGCYDNLIDCGNRLKMEMLLRQIAGRVFYNSCYGHVEVSLSGHNDVENSILVEYLFNVLSNTESILEFKDQKLDWIAAWPQICQEWEPSFAMGILVNVPSSLPSTMINSNVNYPDEVPLM